MFVRRFFTHKSLQHKGGQLLGQNIVTQKDIKNSLAEDGTEDKRIIFDTNTIKTESEPVTGNP
jgi:hypothetical protein